MYPDIIAIGIPFMVACVIVEFVYVFRKKIANYRINGAISNISCGIFEQVTGFISKGLFIALYVHVYEAWRMFTLADTLWVWLSLIVMVDLVFYCFHRFSHRCSFLWAGHVIHHEVEEFNLTVALRRSVMQEFTIIWIYLPFAVFGFSPGAFFLVFAANNLYQFLIHTSHLPQMKTLGLVFNTPYHHEVHHSRNACYIDKNFAGVFIIWDKLFGTFAARTEATDFGIDQPITTLNPVMAQISTLMRVVQETRRRQGWREKIDAFLGSPHYLSKAYYLAKEQGEAPATADSQPVRPKFDPQISRFDLRLVIVSFIVLVVGTTIYRNFEEALSTQHKLLALVLIGFALYGIGRLLDNRRPGQVTRAPSVAGQSSDV